jgi:hypothetical protein
MANEVKPSMNAKYLVWVDRHVAALLAMTAFFNGYQAHEPHHLSI